MNFILAYFVLGLVWSVVDHLLQWRGGYIQKFNADLLWSFLANLVIWPLSMFCVWLAWKGDDRGA